MEMRWPLAGLSINWCTGGYSFGRGGIQIGGWEVAGRHRAHKRNSSAGIPVGAVLGGGWFMIWAVRELCEMAGLGVGRWLFLVPIHFWTVSRPCEKTFFWLF